MPSGPHELTPGARLGPVTIVARLGAGAMGAVYHARHDAHGDVCVKVIASRHPDAEALVRRFRREAEAARRIVHPNVVRGFGLIRVEGRELLVQELVRGGDLDVLLARAGTLDLATSLRITRQVALGLGAAHAAGLVHRDVKPANILLDAAGTARLADLGCVLQKDGRPLDGPTILTAPGTPLGTPLYMSPEQWDGAHEVDFRSDLYALGVLLHRMLAGRVPFDAPGMIQLMRAHQETPPPPLRHAAPATPPPVEALVARLLAKRADERPPSAGAVAVEIDRIAAALGLAAAMGGATTVPPATPAAAGTPGATSPRPIPGPVAPGSGPVGATPTPTALGPGALIGGTLRLAEVLGEGGMGVVHRARHELLGRDLAVKLIRGDFAARPDLRARFLREANALLAFSHKNAVTLRELGEHGGALYMALDLAPGEPLDRVLERDGPFDEARALDIARSILPCLAEAHAAGLIHRDIKPPNLLLEAGPEGDRTRVLDFGIAKLKDALDDRTGSLTQTGSQLGTPYYMAPEQVNGAAVDGRTDLWAVACVLYEVIAGARPFSGDSFAQIAIRIVQEQPPDLVAAAGGRVSREFARAIGAGLAKDPDERPADASAFLARLEAAARARPGRPGRTRTGTMDLGRRPAGQTRRAPMAAILGGATVLLVGGLAAFLALGGDGDGRPDPGSSGAGGPAGGAAGVTPSGGRVPVAATRFTPPPPLPEDAYAEHVVRDLMERPETGFDPARWRAVGASAPRPSTERVFEGRRSLRCDRDAAIERADDDPLTDGALEVAFRDEPDTRGHALTVAGAGHEVSVGALDHADELEVRHRDGEHEVARRPTGVARARCWRRLRVAVHPERGARVVVDGHLVLEVPGLARIETIRLGAGPDARGRSHWDEVRFVRDPRRSWVWEPTPEQEEAARRTGRPVLFENELGMRFVLIPRGEQDLRDSRTGDRSRVTLTRDVYVSDTEVTNEQLRHFLPEHDSGEESRPDAVESVDGDGQPAVRVSWHVGAAFARWLERRTGGGYRLPTEAEWVRAARAGGKASDRWFWGNDERPAGSYANLADRSLLASDPGKLALDTDDGRFTTAPAGSYAPNRFGVHDIVGNVHEWIRDPGGALPAPRSRDPVGPPAAGGRVLRGGAWTDRPEVSVIAHRQLVYPGYDDDANIGFRLALEVGDPAPDAAIVPHGTWWEPAPEQLEAARRHGVPVWFENALGMRFVLVPRGRFAMGSPPGEPDRVEEETLHDVTISEDFYLGATEVANAWFRLAAREHTSREAKGQSLNGEAQPAVYVGWEHANAFCQWLDNVEQAAGRYRLPTEAEWERACRAGTTTARFWGDDDVGAVDHANGSDRPTEALFGFGREFFDHDDGWRVTAPVGSLKPNAWGLHDTLGNVWEWCADWHGPYAAGPVTDPRGPATGQKRVLRGGSWDHYPALHRSAGRRAMVPENGDWNRGFRVACSIEAGRGR